MHDLAPQVTLHRTLDDRCQAFLDRAEQIRKNHTIAAVLELGEAAVREFYDGDVSRSYLRGQAVEEPLAALVERHAQRMAYVGLTIDQVRSAIRAWDVNRQLPPTSQGQLGSSQLRALAAIPSSADRAALANQAVDERWTSHETEAQVATFRQTSGLAGKGGRKPTAAEVKASSAAVRELGRLGEPKGVDGMSLATRVQLRQDLQKLVHQAQAWLRELA